MWAESATKMLFFALSIPGNSSDRSRRLETPLERRFWGGESDVDALKRKTFGDIFGGDENVKNCSPPEKSLIIVGTSKEKDRASSARKNCQIFVKLLSNERTRCAG